MILGEVRGSEDSRVEALLRETVPRCADASLGIGDVLTIGLTPWKVLAHHEGLYIHDNQGHPKRPFRAGVPYFVFDTTWSLPRFP